MKNHKLATESLRSFRIMLDMRLSKYRPLVRARGYFDSFRILEPQELRFGEWYALTREIRLVPIALALPRRLIQRPFTCSPIRRSGYCPSNSRML